jgi:hypothetical protein
MWKLWSDVALACEAQHGSKTSCSNNVGLRLLGKENRDDLLISNHEWTMSANESSTLHRETRLVADYDGTTLFHDIAP